MGNGYVLSERDYRRIQEMLLWYDRNKNLRNTVRRRNIASGGAPANVRRAITTADAGSGDTITANIYDSSGIEQTEGDESGVTVHCSIIGGGNLNTAVPYLLTGDIIFISLIHKEWWCIWWFNGFVDCPEP